jgi:1-deoxy-D-xylulose-5-phosphate reductoisomerase
MKRVAILGSTGSIGRTALTVLARHRARFEVVALTAHNNVRLLAEQASEWHPGYVGVAGVEGAAEGWHTGIESLVEAATIPQVDIVVNAIVGAAGLDATVAALAAGKRVALANKESLVVGGELVTRAAAEGGGELVPIDSEHSAILQCLSGRSIAEVRRVVLTASGGPFREWPEERIRDATPEDALRHPTWRMGRKITIDSATLVNKALEVIEAHHLFGLAFDRIEVVVHPQSIVHSFVEFIDGSVVAQLGVPSMELPILYALTHPERLEDAGIPPFDPVQQSPLTFEPVRRGAFPALALGIAAGRIGGAAPAIFNAANEEAVARFLEGSLRFGEIASSIDGAMQDLAHLGGETREQLAAADAAARRHVRETVGC